MNYLIMNISTLLIVASCGVFISLFFNRALRWIAVIILIMLSVLFPVAGSNLWLWINGAAGELSIVTMILLTVFAVRGLTGCSLLEIPARTHLSVLILLTGFLLYPATLGVSPFDPYSLGYGFELSLLLLSLSILYWVFRQQGVAFILLCVVAAREIGILSSVNAWDYLIDPLLWLFSPAILIILSTGRRKTARIGS